LKASRFTSLLSKETFLHDILLSMFTFSLFSILMFTAVTFYKIVLAQLGKRKFWNHFAPIQFTRLFWFLSAICGVQFWWNCHLKGTLSPDQDQSGPEDVSSRPNPNMLARGEYSWSTVLIALGIIYFSYISITDEQ
jgi:hypothetical protein